MELNLADLKITLDINCLTCPMETDFFESSQRTNYFRMSSINSTSSEQSPRVSESDNTEVASSYDAGFVSGIQCDFCLFFFFTCKMFNYVIILQRL